MVTLSQKDMRGILRHRCDEAGGQRAWAKANGFSDAIVSQALGGTRPVTERMAKSLGYLKKECFVPLQDCERSA